MKAVNSVKPKTKRFGGLLILVVLVGLACRLTSPTPDSWSGTSTSDDIESIATAIANTRLANPSTAEVILITPLAPGTETPVETTPQAVKTSTPAGPWLVYSAPGGDELHAYDISLDDTDVINLPEPILSTDLVAGRAPDGGMLIIRAGSVQNVDELALYQIDVTSAQVTKISPLLSLSLQRNIVNQESQRALQTLEAVTRPDGIAWSPNGRFLAFTAALDNDSSDLYVFDTLNQRIERVNGLFTHNTSPFWSPDSNWLISQEIAFQSQSESWRVENVLKLHVPGYDDQNTLYLPEPESKEEVFLGWVNSKNFISYSLTASGPSSLRETHIESLQSTIIFPGQFTQAAFDFDSSSLAFILDEAHAALSGLTAGVYLLQSGTTDYNLFRAGGWHQLTWEAGGSFIAASSQGVLAFSSDGEEMFLPGEGGACFSPGGNWLVAWGDGELTNAGVRLYQPPSSRPLQILTDTLTNTCLWQADSKGFFLFGEGSLYRFIFPGLEQQLIENGFSDQKELELIWLTR